MPKSSKPKSDKAKAPIIKDLRKLPEKELKKIKGGGKITYSV